MIRMYAIKIVSNFFHLIFHFTIKIYFHLLLLNCFASVHFFMTYWEKTFDRPWRCACQVYPFLRRHDGYPLACIASISTRGGMRAKTKGMMGKGEEEGKEGIAFFITVFAIAWNVFKVILQIWWCRSILLVIPVFWRAVNLQMNRTAKYQGAFSRIMGFAGKRFLFSSLPPPSTFFFCSHSNFCAITLLETLARQARYPWTSAILQKPSRGLVVSRALTVNQVNLRRFIDWFWCCMQRYGVVVL